MKIRGTIATLFTLLLLTGCVGSGPTTPLAEVWRSVGFSYETEKGTLRGEAGRGAAVVGFEKKLSPRLTMGFEAEGR